MNPYSTFNDKNQVFSLDADRLGLDFKDCLIRDAGDRLGHVFHSFLSVLSSLFLGEIASEGGSLYLVTHVLVD